jgi:hypothetical protein
LLSGQASAGGDLQSAAEDLMGRLVLVS